MSMDDLPRTDRMRLTDAVRDMGRTHDDAQRAWIMRAALDDVYQPEVASR